jgi:DUF2927 family protein
LKQNSRQFVPKNLGLAAIAACTMVLATVQGSAAEERKKFTIDQIVDYFDTIVFGSELDPKYASTVVAKWQGSVGYSFQGRFTQQHRTVLDGYIKTVEQLSDLDFKPIDPSDPSPGITFIFVTGNEMSKIPVPAEYRKAVETAAVNSNCYFLSWKKPEYRIVKAIVVADIDRDPAIINSCLLEELVQSLGLPNDSNDLRPSIFSDRDRLFELSPQDRILLYTLYHPEMKPGFSREEALTAAKKIISDLAKKHANQTTSREQGG